MDSGRRAELVDRIADLVLAEGLQGTSLKRMAEAAGTSDRMLLYYFRDKAELVDAVLCHIAERLRAMLDAARAEHPLPPERLRPRLLGLMLHEANRPVLQLWLEIVAAAARGDALLAGFASQMGAGYLGWIAAQLDIDDPGEAEAAARRLLTEIEGEIVLWAVGLSPPAP